MPRCEDFPCCGHAAGECPRIDAKGRAHWRCVDCGKELPLTATSSICRTCLRKAHRRFAETGEMYDEREP